MMLLRILGALFAALALYYVRFFVVRQEQSTFLQVTIVLCALALVLAPRRANWLLIGAAAALGVALFVVMDRDSNSVSDTLTRVAPSFALLIAIVLRLRYEDTASSASAASVGTSS